jgi:hypothetical protein
MAHGDWVLAAGEGLENGQYLRSRNGLFTAHMGPDTNFVVFRGGVGDSHLWESFWTGQVEGVLQKKANGPGPHPGSNIAAMSPGGVFSIYAGVTYPEVKQIQVEEAKGHRDDYGGNFDYANLRGRAVWRYYGNQGDSIRGIPQTYMVDTGNDDWVLALENDGRLRRHCLRGFFGGKAFFITNAADSLVDEEHIPWTKIEYDIEKAVTTPNGPPKVAAKVTGVNKSSSPQEATIHLAYTLTTTTGWKHSAGLKIGAKAEFGAGVPGVSHSKVEISAEVSYGFEWNKAVTTSNTATIDTTVSVPPKKAVMAQVTWQESSVRVPFSVKGMGTFASGAKAPISFNGVYEGISSWDVQPSWVDYEPGKEDHARAMLAEGAGNLLS